MPALEIACPLCGRRLKLPDHRLLGRQARCGQCGYEFVMERRLEAVSEAAPPPRFEFATVDEPKAVGNSGVKPPRVADPPRESAPSPASIDLRLAPDDSLARYRRQPQPRRVAAGWIAALGLLAFSAAAIVGWLLFTGPNRRAGDQRALGGPEQPARGSATSPAERKAPPAAKSVRAASGQPLSLKFVPTGARILIHLRPATFWHGGDRGDEFRECLGPLADWADSQLRTHCLMNPSEIDELLVALVPVGQEAFEVAGIVRTREPISQSDLIARFVGELVVEPTLHYVSRTRAYLIGDARTFAFAPREMAALLTDAARTPAITSDGIQSLLPLTDRNDDFALLCELDDVRLGARTLAPAELQGLLGSTLEFLGDDVETVCWSWRLGTADADFTSELLVRHKSGAGSSRVLRHLQARFHDLPAGLRELVDQARPAASGEEKFLERFPKMAQVVDQSLDFVSDRKGLSFAVSLPERAGPNLALGARLAWQQSLEAAVAGHPPVRERRPPFPAEASIAARLGRRIAVEFRDEPLSAAIEFVGGETDVSFQFDGPGMKLVGVTQNEKQKFSLSNVPAVAVLHHMLQPRDLVLIVDEKKQAATITSAKAAEAAGLTPFPLTSETGD
ncbi:MAG: hypothetical protein ACT4QC_17465 [Planctomycetaceae bacterium]